MSQNDWLEKYRRGNDINQKYRLLREEMARLRKQSSDIRFTTDEFFDLLRDHNQRLDGSLLVFAANDFGYPVAVRPKDISQGLQNEVREEILQEKYKSSDELDSIRRELLHSDSRVHKILVAEHRGDEILYHYPEGGKGNTNFLTVREAVGLIDYSTNSFQADGLSKTY